MTRAEATLWLQSHGCLCLTREFRLGRQFTEYSFIIYIPAGWHDHNYPETRAKVHSIAATWLVEPELKYGQRRTFEGEEYYRYESTSIQ